MKSPLPPITLALSFPSVLVLIAHYGFGMQTSALTIAWIGLALSIVFGVADYLSERRALRNCVTLDIKHNLVSIQGQNFPFYFSTDTQLIGSRIGLADAIDLAVREVLLGKRRFGLRPAVVAHVWPKGRGLCELELEALQEVLEAHFLFPKIEQKTSTLAGAGMSYIDIVSLEGGKHE
ncbi:MAG: hypothetical protein R3260_00030 [Pseudomonas sp.]|nr:hypothetical protein [Pseudomonas sp.]